MTASLPPLPADGGRPLPIVIVGHVDHGKSTLVGRLLNDTGSLPEGKVEAMREMSRRRGMPFEWSFVMDALQAERDQGITIDTTQVRFRTPRRRYLVIDAPGHREFLKNMITGAAGAEAALLVLDVMEGTLEQSRRHAYLLHLLGVRQVALAVNKMDLAEFDLERFERVSGVMTRYLGDLGIVPSAVVPISARNGNNVLERCPQMDWYQGPTVIEALDAFEPAPNLGDRPLRFPVQDVYKFDERRIIAGRIESGRLAVGDTLQFAPGGRQAKVASIESWSEPEARRSAEAGQSIGITLDQPIFIERGQVAAHGETAPLEANQVRVRLFWLGQRPLQVGARYRLKLNTAEYSVTVQGIDRVIDVSDLSSREDEQVQRNEVAEVVLASRLPVVADDFAASPNTGRGVLLDGYDIVGGCTIEAVVPTPPRHITPVGHAVTTADRTRANGHRGGILWLTGLSGSGKSTLALALERELFRRGCQVFALDGDTLRQGINQDLDFSPEARAENVRRVAEVARLFAEAGVIVIVALISPSRAQRTRAREIGGPHFHLVYVAADVAACEARDPKGLYRKARAGLIPNFTGVSAPYEPPLRPELVIDTAAQTTEEGLAALLDYAERHLLRPDLGDQRPVGGGDI